MSTDWKGWGAMKGGVGNGGRRDGWMWAAVEEGGVKEYIRSYRGNNVDQTHSCYEWTKNNYQAWHQKASKEGTN